MSFSIAGAAALTGMSPDSAYVSYTVDQAAAQITRDNDSWGGSVGRAVNVTFAFRAHDATYENGDASGFTEFNKAQIDASLLSFQSWSDVANIGFTRVGSGDTGTAAYADGATILLGDYSSGADNAAAFTYLPYSSAEGGDVWVNGTLSYNKAPTALGYGALTLTHEIGHAIGLEHPGDYDASDDSDPTYWEDAAYREDSMQYSFMSYFSETATGANYNGNFASVPLLDDIAAAQRLYGANMNTRATDTVYGFNSTAGRPWFSATSASSRLIFCIWDAGGHDTLDFSGYSTPCTIDLQATHFSSVGTLTANVSIAEGVTIEDAIGGSGYNEITGNEVANHLWGGSGDDNLNGMDGADTLSGGDGTNWLYGGDGVDTVTYANAGQALENVFNHVEIGRSTSDYLNDVERLFGTAFADHFELNGYIDSVFGGAGDDFATWDNNIQFFDGGDGIDTVIAANSGAPIDIGNTVSVERLKGTASGDMLIGNKEANLISGLDGADTLEGGGGADTLDGGQGVNTASFAHASSGARVNLGSHLATVGADQIVLKSIDGVKGSGFADVVIAPGVHGVLDGGAGDDTFQVSADGVGQSQAIIGGLGVDTLSFSTAKSAVQVSLTGANGEVVSGIEQVIGSAYGDTLSGSTAAETLDGRGGDDVLNGAGGADHLIGSGGLDTVTYAAATRGMVVGLTAGTDSTGATLSTVENITGGAYKDTLTGDGNANVLNGGGAADVLAGGSGADTLIGGAGNDLFVYTTVTQSTAKGGIDLIADLQAKDTIDLSAIDADKKAAGDQAFTVVDHFDKHAAELVLSYDASTSETRVSLDINGDGAADMVIRLSGDDSAYSHFIL